MAKLKMTAAVTSQVQLAEGIYDLRLAAGEIAAQAVPGQFVSLYSKDGSRLLPRPISLCGIDKEKGELRLVYRVAGAGTKEFSALTAGDTIDVLGPLGNGFPLLEGKKAFLIGGLICALVQILMEKTKMMPGRIMVLLVCTGAVLGAVGAYEPFRKFAGAGASVPLLGFGNVLWKGVKEAVDADGFLGIFKGGFQASAVGISAALVFGYLASLIFQPKMKK